MAAVTTVDNCDISQFHMYAYELCKCAITKCIQLFLVHMGQLITLSYCWLKSVV